MTKRLNSHQARALASLNLALVDASASGLFEIHAERFTNEGVPGYDVINRFCDGVYSCIASHVQDRKEAK